jgi:hypothetical protein
MSSAAPTTAPAAVLFKKAGLRETAVLLVLAWFMPFAVHLLPWAGARPLGAYLAKALAAAVLTPGALFGSVAAFGGFFGHLLTGSWPGLGVLAAMNVALVRFYPKGAPEA